MNAEYSQTVVRLPRVFYVALAILMTVMVFVGFWPTYYGPLLTGVDVDKVPFIHFHAAVYVGWLALFVAQTVLAATGHTRIHMNLGKVGIVYGLLIIVVGTIAAFVMFAVRVKAGESDVARMRLLAPLVDMIVFAPYFGAAIYNRSKPDRHKRLMIVATTSLLIAAVGRMTFLGSPPNMIGLQLIWISPILLGIAYDLYTRRGISAIYVSGILVLLAELNLRFYYGRQSEIWQELATWFASFIS